MYCYSYVHAFGTDQCYAKAVFAILGHVSLKLDKAARRQNEFLYLFLLACEEKKRIMLSAFRSFTIKMILAKVCSFSQYWA
jgi:hypothetical protein